METRLKERLTGAAILVALIVMLVPEMFRGEGDRAATPGAPAAAGSSGAEGAPLRSYTIDLSNNPKGTAPLQSGNDAANASPKLESTTAELPKAPPKVESPKVESPRVEPAKAEAPKAEPSKAEPQKGESAKATARSEAAATAASKPVASKTGPSGSSGSASVSGNWSVQLGLFAKRENAERLLTEVKAKGFNASITGADSKGLFHVRTPGTSDRASAQAMALRLKGEGFAAAVVAP